MYKKNISVAFATILILNFNKTFNLNILGQENKREWAMLFYIKSSLPSSELIQEKLTQLKNGSNNHCYISVTVDQELEEAGQEKTKNLKKPRIIEQYEIEDHKITRISEQKIFNQNRTESVLSSFDLAKNKPSNNFFLGIIDLDKLKKRADQDTPIIGIFNECERDLRLSDKELREVISKLHNKLKKTIDLVFLDIDLSGNIETAFALRHDVKSLICFQERYNPEIVDYSKILNLLKLSHVRPLDFARNIIELFDERIPEQKRFSVSLINLSKINLDFLDSFNNIFASLGAFIDKDNCFLKYTTKSRNQTTKFGDKRFVDLLGLYLTFIDNTKSITCTNKQTLDRIEKDLKNGYNVLKDLIIAHKSNFNTNGVSIYFPQSGKTISSYNHTCWAENSWWPYFLFRLKNSLEERSESL